LRCDTLFHYFECLMIMLSMCHVYYDYYNEYHVSIYTNSHSQRATQALFKIRNYHQKEQRKLHCKD
jgi:hypothetical protein